MSWTIRKGEAGAIRMIPEPALEIRVSLPTHGADGMNCSSGCDIDARLSAIDKAQVIHAAFAVLIATMKNWGLDRSDVNELTDLAVSDALDRVYGASRG